jgi:hypothetical protein
VLDVSCIDTMSLRESFGVLPTVQPLRQLTPCGFGLPRIREGIPGRIDFDTERGLHDCQRFQHQVGGNRFVTCFELANARRTRAQRARQVTLRPAKRFPASTHEAG